MVNLKELEGSGRNIFEMQFRDVPVGTEENYESVSQDSLCSGMESGASRL
jgi:hypothetical protein